MAIVMASSKHISRWRRDVDRTSKRRLSWSLALSLVIHAVAIAVLADMLQSALVSPASRPGVALPIEIALVAKRPIAFSAPPEAPQELPPLPPAEVVPEDNLKARKPSPSEVDLPQPPISPQQRTVATPSPGATTVFEPGTEFAATDAPPPGDVAVGPLNDPESIGRVQALRLASRYPQKAYKRPRLLSTLTVPYPLRAAFAHRDARITVLMLIDTGGRIIDTTLYPDDPFFSATVLASLRGVTFSPAETADGNPIPYWAIVEFVFRMRR